MNLGVANVFSKKYWFGERSNYNPQRTTIMTDPQDTVLAKAGTQMIVEVFKASLAGLPQFVEWIKGNTRKYDPLNLAAKKYKESFEKCHNTIRVLAMPRPVPLREIYVKVNMLDKVSSRTTPPIGDLYRSYLKHGFRLRELRKTHDALKVVNERNNLVVLGAPGAGKTTFLKYVGLKALDLGLTRPVIPVFVSLKDWSDTGKTLLDYIIEQFDVCKFPDAKLFIEKSLDEGSLILLLDGFDEVSGKVDSAIYSIKKFVEKYDRNQYILSCRVAAYQYVFEHFTDVEIADFDDEQIQAFVENWFRDDKDKSFECWTAIADKKNARIKELASSPLLLTMLCLVFSDTLRFPANRSELYKEGIDILLKKWDASRSIKRHDIYRDLSLKRKEALLSQVAYRTFSKSEYLIPERVLLHYIADFSRHLPALEGADPAMIIKAIELQHGLLVECAKNVYAFSHLTFQEYFAARFLVDNEARGVLTRALEKHFLDDEWREVILLSAGMVANGDRAIWNVRSRLSQVPIGGKVAGVFKEIERMIFDESYCIPLTKAFLLGHVFRNSARLAFLANAIAEGLYHHLNIREREKLMLEMDKDVARLRADDPEYTILFDRIRGDVESSVELENYLKGTELVVSCLNADCYVSTDARHAILRTLLSEPFVESFGDMFSEIDD